MMIRQLALALLPALLSTSTQAPMIEVMGGLRITHCQAEAREGSFSGSVSREERSTPIFDEWIRDLDADLVDGQGSPLARAESHLASNLGSTSIVFSLDGSVQTTKGVAGEASAGGAHRVVFRVLKPTVVTLRAHTDATAGDSSARLSLTGPEGTHFALAIDGRGGDESIERALRLGIGVHVLDARLALQSEGSLGGAQLTGNVEAELQFAPVRDVD